MFRQSLMMLVIFATAFTISPANAGRIDITKAFLAQPEAVEFIDSICKKMCAGNDRKSWLTQAQLDIIPDDTYSILQIQVRLRNRHKSRVFGKRFTLYSDHSTLKAKIRIHNDTCEVSIGNYKKDIYFSNDLYKITWWLVARLDKVFDSLQFIKNHMQDAKLCTLL